MKKNHRASACRRRGFSNVHKFLSPGRWKGVCSTYRTYMKAQKAESFSTPLEGSSLYFFERLFAIFRAQSFSRPMEGSLFSLSEGPRAGQWRLRRAAGQEQGHGRAGSRGPTSKNKKNTQNLPKLRTQTLHTFCKP